MLPIWQEHFANPGSTTHEPGRQVRAMVDASIAQISSVMGAEASEIVVTSGATESNNLALFGVCLHPRQKRRRIVSLATEHKAILDPLERLSKQGFEVVLLPVHDQNSSVPGLIDLDQLADAIDDNTALVSVMLANNEIGVVQPLREISRLCRQSEVPLHCDATQAVGRMAVDVDQLGLDLMSFSAHKFYGPKGVGGLFVRRRERRVRLWPQIVGGGQQGNLRSGTLNSPGIIGMAQALALCQEQMPEETQRIGRLRNRLYERLEGNAGRVLLNGPTWSEGAPELRMPGNLNCSFYPIEGQSLMLETPELAVSSGSACTSAEPAPSHVLLAIGLSEDQARSSLRFGVGRFNTQADIDQAADWLIEAADRLRRFL